MALISIDQYQDRVGTTFAGAEATRINALIDDASALVLQIADMDTDWTDATVPDVVVPVVVSMVRRSLENPLGLSGEQIGQYQWQASSGNATAIHATMRETRIIRKAAGRLGAGTVQLEGYLSSSGPVVAMVDDLVL